MFYKKFVRPVLFRKDAEEAHMQALSLLHHVGRIPPLRARIRQFCNVRHTSLWQELFGLTFPNPVGLAAGMDKNGYALDGLAMLGFGFVELGGVTANKQAGNPQPRMFRLPADEAIINRMGFNNLGAEQVAYGLGRSGVPDHLPVGANIGKSMSVSVEDMDAVVNDYCYTLAKLHPFVQFTVVNVSSPNTQNLRQLQGQKFLRPLLSGIKRQNEKLPRNSRKDRAKPILIKVAPDLTIPELDDVLSVGAELGIDGIVATNTTVNREGLKTHGGLAGEKGGLSGKPLHQRALYIVRYIRQRLPKIPIIGVGGIFSGSDAYGMLQAGANLVQVYTGLVYEGPFLPWRMNKELIELMERDGTTVKSFSPNVTRE